MPQLLLELFSEEIPARMQADAASHLIDKFPQFLSSEVRQHINVRSFSTPRRITLLAEGLPIKLPDTNAELKGPKIGAPEAAMQGFLKKTGLTIDQLEQRDGVYFANIRHKGRDTAETLKDIIEPILQTFPWPKSMRWGSGETAWVRPLHSILCLFDGEVVPVEFAGVKAGNFTFGHRFLAPEKIIISDAEQYESALEKAYVLADRDKRKAEIARQLDAKCKTLGVTLHNDPGLLEEVTGLVEWPVILSGKIDDAFMDLPPEVLILEMRNHQKYFATLPTGSRADANASHGISAHFLITSNMITKDEGKAIIAGNERVLRARFADGRFFWDMDRKTKLEAWAKKLGDVTYHAELGSMKDKADRIFDYAQIIAPYVNADMALVKQAAALCKADLVTGMVGEFPELQGVMGRYYANHESLDPQVADAIRDHYKPQGPHDTTPTAPVSVCLALADKFDTVFSMRSMAETSPTGSKDPFAVRRAMLAINQLIQKNNVQLPLGIFSKKLFGEATQQKFEKIKDNYIKHLKIKENGKVVFVTITDDLLAFAYDRLKVQLKDQGIRHDVIKAVVANGDDDLVRIVARAKALQEFLTTEDGANLLAAYKRAANILAIEEKKDKLSYVFAELNGDALVDTEERALAAALAEKSPQISAYVAKENFTEAMKTAALLRPLVDVFFEKTMVNCDARELRANRLRLLSGITTHLDALADFSRIEG